MLSLSTALGFSLLHPNQHLEFCANTGVGDQSVGPSLGDGKRDRWGDFLEGVSCILNLVDERLRWNIEWGDEAVKTRVDRVCKIMLYVLVGEGFGEEGLKALVCTSRANGADILAVKCSAVLGGFVKVVSERLRRLFVRIVMVFARVLLCKSCLWGIFVSVFFWS